MSSAKVKPNYISKKGYVVHKHKDNDNLIWKIKKDLNVTAKGCPGYGPDEPASFKVYIENDKKIYIPVHYGLKHGGQIKTKLPFTP